MKTRYSTSQIFTLVLVVALTAIVAFAQVETARITGTITDSSGAVIPGAKITFTHVATNTSFTMESDAVGRYISPPLKLGEYQVTVEAAGFKREVRSGIVLQVNQIATLDISLELGAVTETVSVTANAPLLDTTRSTQGQVIDNRRMVDLPLNGRDYIQLALLSAGAVEPLGGRFGGFSAGGTRTTQNNYMLDGMDNNGTQIAAQARQAETVKPPIDAIQEFKISTNDFSAEYGRAMGAIVNVTTRSGSNELHGTVYEFLRNEKLDARNLFQAQGTKKPPFKRNQYGFSVGGPILKNKLFYFGDYEATRIRESRTVNVTIPTVKIRSGDFTETGDTIYDPFTYDDATKTRTPFPNNVIPASRFDPIAAKANEWYPDPTNGNLTQNFFANPPVVTDEDKWDARVDYNLGQSDTLYYRFSFQRRWLPGSPTLPEPAWGGGGGTDFEHNGRNMGLVWNHIFTPTLISSTRLGWNKIFTERQSKIDYNVASQLGLAGVNQSLAGTPVFNITGYTNLGISMYTPNLIDSQARQLVNDTTWTKGAHTVKFGVNLEWLQSYLTNPQQELGTFFFNGNYSRNPQNNKGGDGYADFLLGTSYRGDTSTSVYMNLRAPWTQFYVQDKWRVTQKLTLNIGLRYELNRNWVEKDNLFSMYDIDTDPNNPQWVLPKSGGGRFDRALIEDDAKLVPRFGFAYRLFKGTVLRGGYGMYAANYVPTGGGQYLETNPPFHMKVRMSTDSRHVTLRLRDGMPAGILTPEKARSLSFSTFERHPTMPLSQQWNFNIQQQFGQDWMWEIGYYGTKANHLVHRWDGNYALPAPGNIDNNRRYTSAVWPGTNIVVGPLGSFNSHLFNGNSLFHSLQTKLEKRFSNGFTVLTSYIWSKTIGDVNGFASTGNTPNSGMQNPLDWRAERSLADQHLAHRFVTSYIYELPFGQNKKWGSGWNSVLKGVLGGWAVGGITTLRSGQPAGLSVKGNPANSSTANRPNVVGDWHLSRSERTLDRWFNTDAFVPNNKYEYGNAGRNIIIRPGRVNFDMAAYKRFQILERLAAQFRFEMFNAFNTPPIGSPNLQVGNKSFGKITSAGRPRLLQFGLKLIW